MKYNKKIFLNSVVLAFLALSMLFPILVSSQVSYDKLNAAEVSQVWLRNNCDVGENNSLHERIKALALEVEPMFIMAFREGPSSEDISKVQNLSRKQYETIQNGIKSGENFGLKKEDVDIARSQSLPAFLENEKNNFLLAFRSQALMGLSITAGEAGKNILQQVASDEKSPLTPTAKYAIKKMESKK